VIKAKVEAFLAKLCKSSGNTKELAQKIAKEFSTELASKLEKTLSDTGKKEFKLRLSAMGRSLRQLLLEKKYGRTQAGPTFLLKMLYGHLYEALFITFLKHSGVRIDALSKKVKLKVNDEIEIPGELDIILEGKIYDIKTASDYAYKYKFLDYTSLMSKDDFGYFGQGFGYSEADNTPFGGWLVINKSTGDWKMIEIPREIHKELREKYVADIKAKAEHITYRPDEIPPCEGVVEETFNGKKTGNYFLDKSCEWCPYKDGICHKKLTHCDDVNSKAKTKVKKYYVHLEKNA
jgi:hypothetical protein